MAAIIPVSIVESLIGKPLYIIEQPADLFYSLHRKHFLNPLRNYGESGPIPGSVGILPSFLQRVAETAGKMAALRMPKFV